VEGTQPHVGVAPLAQGGVLGHHVRQIGGLSHSLNTGIFDERTHGRLSVADGLGEFATANGPPRRHGKYTKWVKAVDADVRLGRT